MVGEVEHALLFLPMLPRFRRDGDKSLIGPKKSSVSQRLLQMTMMMKNGYDELYPLVVAHM